jgi:P-type Cu+ transporter
VKSVSSPRVAETSPTLETLEVPLRGLCCAQEAREVREAIAALPGVTSVEVLLGAQKALVRCRPSQVTAEAIWEAVAPMGCAVPEAFTPEAPYVARGLPGKSSPGAAAVTQEAHSDPADPAEELSRDAAGRAEELSRDAAGRAEELSRDAAGRAQQPSPVSRASTPKSASPPAPFGSSFGRAALILFAGVAAVVLLVTVLGETLGLMDAVTHRVPWPAWLVLLAAGGYPVFRGVFRAALRRRVTSHTLMTAGVLAAVAVNEWAAALVVVLFMRIAAHIEGFTTQKARGALRDLAAMAPQVATLERDGTEVQVPVEQLRPRDVVVVRPGGQVPVDGEVVDGHATVDQAAITGESLPVEAEEGTTVFAASLVRLGMLRVRVTRVGADTTFGRVIRLVEEAEANRAEVQRTADRFATWYLPVVLSIALLTFFIGGNPLAAAAVLVVACSCALAMATPVAMLASIGSAARRGLVIKGGKYVEALDRAQVLLLDKTGTLTLGRPHITDVVPMNGASTQEVLALAASAERYSEHPLAGAVRSLAHERGLPIPEPQEFRAIPGVGVEAKVGGRVVTVGRQSPGARPAGWHPSDREAVVRRPDRDRAEAVGRRPDRDRAERPRLLDEQPVGRPDPSHGTASAQIAALESQGKALLFVTRDGDTLGVLAASDTLRPEVPEAIAALRSRGFAHMELLTGDHEAAAANLAGPLGLTHRSGLLPEDKIVVVREYQAMGYTVVMVGDGVNDAPALAQADVGVAMGAAGTHVAMEAAHLVLMGDDWRLVPHLFQMARRTMGVVRLNLGFTAVYNLVGLSLAALGILPLVLAAAAQSLPDLGIMANSSRLLRGTREAR